MSYWKTSNEVVSEEVIRLRTRLLLESLRDLGVLAPVRRPSVLAEMTRERLARTQWMEAEVRRRTT